jgi:hypothetical protein
MIYLRYGLILAFPAILAVLFNYSFYDWKFWLIDFYFVTTAIVSYSEGYKNGIFAQDKMLQKGVDIVNWTINKIKK